MLTRPVKRLPEVGLRRSRGTRHALQQGKLALEPEEFRREAARFELLDSGFEHRQPFSDPPDLAKNLGQRHETGQGAKAEVGIGLAMAARSPPRSVVETPRVDDENSFKPGAERGPMR